MANTSITLDELLNEINKLKDEVVSRPTNKVVIVEGSPNGEDVVGRNTKITMHGQIVRKDAYSNLYTFDDPGVYEIMIAQGSHHSSDGGDSYAHVSIINNATGEVLWTSPEAAHSVWWGDHTKVYCVMLRFAEPTVIRIRSWVTGVASSLTGGFIKFTQLSKILYYKILDLFLSLFSRREVMRIG